MRRAPRERDGSRAAGAGGSRSSERPGLRRSSKSSPLILPPPIVPCARRCRSRWARHARRSRARAAHHAGRQHTSKAGRREWRPGTPSNALASEPWPEASSSYAKAVLMGRDLLARAGVRLRVVTAGQPAAARAAPRLRAPPREQRQRPAEIEIEPGLAQQAEAEPGLLAARG